MRSSPRPAGSPLRLIALGLPSLAIYVGGFAMRYPLLPNAGRAHISVVDFGPDARLSALFYILCVVALFALYGLGRAWALPTRPDLWCWGVLIGAAMLFCLALSFTYPVGSTDVYDYIIRGRMLGLGGDNPFYTIPEYGYQSDPFFRFINWPKTPSAYGPLWELPAAGLARLAGDGLAVNVLAFKAFDVLAYLADVALIVAILRRVAPKRALSGAYLFAWNPLVLLETAANGHNDSLMLLFVLLGVYLYARACPALGALAQVGGALIKFIPGLLFPLFLVGALAQRPPARRLRALIGVLLAAAVLGAACYAPFWGSGDVLGLGRRTHMFTTSLPALIFLLMRPTLPEAAPTLANGLALAALGAFLIYRTLSVWRDPRPMTLIRAAHDVLLFYLLAACTWFWPWYVMWVVALGALRPPGPAQTGTALFSLTAGWKPLVRSFWKAFTGRPLETWGHQLVSVAVVMALPWLYFLGALVVTGLRALSRRKMTSRTARAILGNDVTHKERLSDGRRISRQR
jgi:alpha-1,6-mannosyltransferase